MIESCCRGGSQYLRGFRVHVLGWRGRHRRHGGRRGRIGGGEEDDVAWVVHRESEAAVAISGEAIDHGADFCCRDRFMEGIEFPKASYERIVGKGG